MLLRVSTVNLNLDVFDGSVTVKLNKGMFFNSSLVVPSSQTVELLAGNATIDLAPSSEKFAYLVLIHDSDNKLVYRTYISIPSGLTEINLEDAIGLETIGDPDYDFVGIVTQVLRENPDLVGEVSSGFYQSLSATDSPNFQLTNTPQFPSVSILTVDGIKQRFGRDYVINGSTLQWLGFPLRSEWDIDLIYR